MRVHRAYAKKVSHVRQRYCGDLSRRVERRRFDIGINLLMTNNLIACHIRILSIQSDVDDDIKKVIIAYEGQYESK